MPGPIEIDTDPTKALEVSVAEQTHNPELFAYRLWFKQPNETDWTLLAHGDTRKPPPYHHSPGKALAKDTKLLLKIALGGHKNSKYHMIVTFLQDGKICPNGIVSEPGTTSGNGSAVIRQEVTLV